MANMPMFVIRKTRDKFGRRRYRVNLVGPNGKRINTSEPLNSIEAVSKNIKAAQKYSSLAGERWAK